MKESTIRQLVDAGVPTPASAMAAEMILARFDRPERHVINLVTFSALVTAFVLAGDVGAALFVGETLLSAAHGFATAKDRIGRSNAIDDEFSASQQDTATAAMLVFVAFVGVVVFAYALAAVFVPATVFRVMLGAYLLLSFVSVRRVGRRIRASKRILGEARSQDFWNAHVAERDRRLAAAGVA